jgi:hypothetical protein
VQFELSLMLIALSWQLYEHAWMVKYEGQELTVSSRARAYQQRRSQSHFFKKNLYTLFYLKLKIVHLLYTQFCDFF